MSRILLFSLLVSILLLSGMPTATSAADTQEINTSGDNGFTLDQLNTNQSPLGVVIIDDTHANDYVTNGGMELVDDYLEDLGYVVELASSFGSFAAAVDGANYLIIPAAYSEFTETEIDTVLSWFNNESANLLLASRGDFQEFDTDPLPKYQSMNYLLANLSTEMRVQDDNVNTIDQAAYRPWYIDTDNFNSNYSSLADGVSEVSYFSPSSVSYSGNAEPLMFAEARAYQLDQSGSPPAVIYDDTDDGAGGQSIPLAVIDSPTVGIHTDRIITVGTTLWSDYDFGDSFADDIVFFDNIMSYFTNETLNEVGEINIKIPDVYDPEVGISYPHNEATLKGTVNVSIDVFDSFGEVFLELKIDDLVVGNESSFTWDTTAYAEGSHTFTATARDPAGNTASVTYSFVIDQDFQPSASSTPKIMTYNIRQSGAYEAWFDVVVEENPDVAVLVETGDFDDNGDQMLNKVTNDLNEIYFDYLPYQSYTLQDIDNSYDGITILSRYDILDNSKVATGTADDGHTVSYPLPFLHSVLDMQGEEVHVVGAHLTCCPGQSAWNARASQQESINNFMDELGNVPLIYLGDLNTASPDDVNPDRQVPEDDLGTEPIEMILDNTHPSAPKYHKFTDVAVATGLTADTYIGNVLSRIDYIFVNHFFQNRIISSTTGDTGSAGIGSDHVPVDVVLDMTSALPDTSYTAPTSTKMTSSVDSDSPSIGLSSYHIVALSFMLLVPAINRKRRN